METLTLLKVAYGPLIALLLTSGLILWLSPLAHSAGLVDRPNARKKHKGNIPLIGGPAIFVAVFAAMVVSGIGLSKTANWSNFGAFYLASMLLILAGTVDDYLDLSPLQKAIAQALAGLVMVLAPTSSCGISALSAQAVNCWLSALWPCRSQYLPRLQLSTQSI